MSVVLASATVAPDFHQIAVADFDSDDVPEWETGEEPLVWSPGCFLISTIDSADGNVELDMRVGDVDVPGVRVVFEGTFHCSSGIVSATGPVDYPRKTFLLPRRGRWTIRIAVRNSGASPDYVAFFFDREEWEAAVHPG